MRKERRVEHEIHPIPHRKKTSKVLSLRERQTPELSVEENNNNSNNNKNP